MRLRTLLLLLAALLAGIVFTTQFSHGATGNTFSSPQLNLILPRGIQRGQEHVLTFSGARLDDAEEIFLYDPTGVEIKNLEIVDAANLKVTVLISEDCRIGEHMAQIRCKSGVSEYRSFFVGALPSVAEVEPNNEFAEPQAIESGVTVDGICTNEDVDHYVVNCKKGERLNVEIEGMRLGTMFFDPFIAILDKDRFEIAVSDDTPLTKQDGMISIVVPEDGQYTILVRETAYRGNAGSYYRLHVGKFPRPSVAFPAGGKPGETVSVRFIGDAAGEVVNELVVGEEPRNPKGIAVTDDQGISPSPVVFKISPLDNLIEVEPNEDFDQATPCTLPIAINGIIDQETQADWFKFTATKDATYDIDCFSKRVNSSLDAVINIFDSAKNHLVGNDDARGLDAYLRWVCPADGEYYLRVRDHLQRGGPDFVYRVEIAPPKPKLYVDIPRVDLYSQRRQTIMVPQGGRYGTQFQISRLDFGGPVAIDQTGLPTGVTMAGGPTVGNLTTTSIVYEAAADAPIGGTLVEMNARHVENAQIEGPFFNIADFVLGVPNNSRFIAGTVTEIPIVVVERLPFTLELVQPKVPLVRDGQISIKIIAHRDEGFTKPIQLEFPFRPPGVGTIGSVMIPEGANEAIYPLNANAQAQIGDWQVYVLGSADVGGTAYQSSQLATLKIAERFLTMAMSPAACEQGQQTDVVCAVTPMTEFAGNAKAELIGLPPESTAEAVEVTKETTEVVFKVITTDKTPPGKHRGLFCQLTIVDQEEPIVAVAGRGELQVDVPLPKAPAADAAAEPTPPPAAEPAAKPLSRLEKLRAEAQKQRDARNKQK